MINELLLTPIKSFRLRYLPLLMLYFAYGAASFSGIAESFFVKEQLNFSAATLMMIAVWLTLPWTVKMVFGQLVDSIPIFGSIRRAYIFIAGGFMVIGGLLLAGLAGKWQWVFQLGSSLTLYLTANLLIVIGLVLQDVVADAMSVEVVVRTGQTEEAIKHELAMVQLLGRLALSIAMFLVAGLGGWLAEVVSYQTIFLLTLIIPFISVSSCLLVNLEVPVLKPVNWKILGGGILYAWFIILTSWLAIPFNQEIIFLVSLIVVIYFLNLVIKDVAKPIKKQIICAAIVIFIYRAMPAVGPGLQWWEIDVLGFNKVFFGTLAQISAGLTIVGMWAFAKYITQKPIGWIFITLTIIGTVLSLPVLGMYYGLHHWTQTIFGFGAQTIAIIDTAVGSPFAQLSMIPMLTLIAIYAPRGNAATWFALMASLMNLALMAGNLISKLLNQIWIISREIKNPAGEIIVQANYNHLGILLWITVVAGFVIPIAAVLVFLKRDLSTKTN